MRKEPNVVKESITFPISKKKIDAVNKIQKPQASKREKDNSISNKKDKSKSLDKSGSTQRAET